MKRHGFSAKTIAVLEKATPKLHTEAHVDRRLAGLRERGFANPVKLLTANPAALRYSFKKIDQKIAGLRERGFTNPVELCTAHPVALGYSFENIDKKLHYACRLSKFGVNGVALVEFLPQLLGCALQRIRFLTRIVCSLTGGHAGVFVELATKDPLALLVGRLTAEEPTMQALRRSIRRCKGHKAENLAFLLRQDPNNKLVRAFLAYRPLPKKEIAAAA